MSSFESNPALRREFITRLATATGAVVLAPVVQACGGSTPKPESAPTGHASETVVEVLSVPVPLAKPEGWDPIVYNRERGNAGAIPASYLPAVNAADGVQNALGKHLPYIPQIDASLVPAGYIAIMWGDESKGYARHPNAVPGPKNENKGHWFNWIRLRKATDGTAEETESLFSAWPQTQTSDNGRFTSDNGGDVQANDGKDTVYLVALPPGAHPGDELRVYGNCLTHGEYVDFLTI